MSVQQWKTKLHRWHQLSRYYVNKWHYDGTKWAERIWYGTGTTNPNAVASVPFMITRNMRAQLEERGFPSHAISSLVPKVAHQLIQDNVTYAVFQQQHAQTSKPTNDTSKHEIEELVATIQAREANTIVMETSKTIALETNEMVVVPESKTKREDGNKVI